MLLLKYSVYDGKKLELINEQEPAGLLSSLGIKTPLRRIPLVGLLWF